MKKNFSILIIEDDDIDAKALQRALTQIGIAADLMYRAYDGIEALELLKQKKPPLPCIIIIDINMPRMTGIEFLQHLHQDAVYGSSPAFILTTSNSNADKQAAYESHVTGYMLKENVGKSFSNFIQFFEAFTETIELP